MSKSDQLTFIAEGENKKMQVLISKPSVPQKHSVYKLQHLDGLTITDSRPGKHQDGSSEWGQVASQEAGIRKGEEPNKFNRIELLTSLFFGLYSCFGLQA